MRDLKASERRFAMRDAEDDGRTPEPARWVGTLREFCTPARDCPEPPDPELVRDLLRLRRWESLRVGGGASVTVDFFRTL